MMTAKDKCLLLLLPLELRQEIYRAVFAVPSGTHNDSYFNVKTAVGETPAHLERKLVRPPYTPISIYTSKSSANTISILLTCRQIYDEAVSFLYQQNHFRIILGHDKTLPYAATYEFEDMLFRSFIDPAVWKKIRTLKISLSAHRMISFKKWYLTVQSWLMFLALETFGCGSGNTCGTSSEHSLVDLTIEFFSYVPWEIMRQDGCHHMLDPLAFIHGVRSSITIGINGQENYIKALKEAMRAKTNDRYVSEIREFLELKNARKTSWMGVLESFYCCPLLKALEVNSSYDKISYRQAS